MEEKEKRGGVGVERGWTKGNGKTHTGLFRVTWSASRAQRERILTFSVEGRAFVEEGVVGNGAVASFTRSCSIHDYAVREDFARNTGNFGRVIFYFEYTVGELLGVLNLAKRHRSLDRLSLIV